ncbi:hypothetical protein [Reyranella sp.]|uniref:barstar family protein n=1 Tax=Reyranella sp. TaxID=1929291 RepID=UPI0025CC7027|nr:hypothetical protein [Reyranella sp.]
MDTRNRADLPTIQLSAGAWKEAVDFVDALKGALGAIKGCGSSLDAMIDLMVYGGMSRIEPPYVVEISEVDAAPQEVRDHIALIAQAVATARKWKKERYGDDVEVSIEIAT